MCRVDEFRLHLARDDHQEAIQHLGHLVDRERVFDQTVKNTVFPLALAMSPLAVLTKNKLKKNLYLSRPAKIN